MNASGSARSSGRREYVVRVALLLILLLALGLRLYSLDTQSLWNDEGSSVTLAQRDLITIAREAARDIHPPLYYWLLSGWVRLVGTSEVAARSFSALLGVGLVALTYVLGRLLIGRWAGLVAALLAAINPLQIYYSQEARMYMLAAVLAAGAVVALIHSVQDRARLSLVALVLLEAAGLYTHYSFVFVILVLNLAYGSWLLLNRHRGPTAGLLVQWGISQVLVILVYLPWLPTAWRQATTWPSPAQTTALLPALADTWRWLVFGPTVETAQVVVPLLLAGMLGLLGLLSLGLGLAKKPVLRSEWVVALLTLWLGLPVVLIFALGLYRQAYLKFLLVTAPAVSLLLTCGLLGFPRPGSHHTVRASRAASYALLLVQIAAALSILVVSGLALRTYYTDPAYARDDYRSIATYVEAVGRPGDAVLLNAPGQQEVFGYYYNGHLPVHPLPESRPLDPAATESALSRLAQPGMRIFAVLWATDESDPGRLIEGWLDAHAHKALDTWYGNVRLVVYAVPEQVPSMPDQSMNILLKHVEMDDEILLLGYSLLNARLTAGDIAQITLFWKANETLTQRYKVFLHVLDGGNHIVGQRDAEPGGGVKLTTLWTPGEVVADNHGLPIHPATPPGEYRMEVGLYNPETGQRLSTPDGQGQVWLEPVLVDRPPAPAPIAALGMQHARESGFGELTMLGYDAYRLGAAPQHDASLLPGDVLHVNLYWQAETQPSGDWQVAIALWDSDNREWIRVTTQPVGDFPTSQWQAGDVWRGQFNVSIPDDAPAGRYWLRVQPLAPDGSSPGTFLSEPLHVGP